MRFRPMFRTIYQLTSVSISLMPRGVNTLNVDAGFQATVILRNSRARQLYVSAYCRINARTWHKLCIIMLLSMP